MPLHVVRHPAHRGRAGAAARPRHALRRVPPPGAPGEPAAGRGGHARPRRSPTSGADAARARPSRTACRRGWSRCPCCARGSACWRPSSSWCRRPRSGTSASSATRRRRPRAATTRRCRRTSPSATVFLLDPMLATGGSAAMAVDGLAGLGARNVRLLSIVAAPEGVDHLDAVVPGRHHLYGGAGPRAERPQVHPPRPRRLRRQVVRDVTDSGGRAPLMRPPCILRKPGGSPIPPWP